MKNWKKILSLLGAVTLFPTGAAELKMTDSGELKVGEIRFQTSVWNRKWNSAAQSSRTVVPAPDFPKRSGKRFELKGTFTVPGQKFGLTETAELSPEKIRLNVELLPNGDGDFQYAAMTAVLKHERFVLNPPEIDGKRIGFPSKTDPVNWIRTFEFGEHKIELPLKNGILSIRGKFGIILQDDRKFNQQEWSLRLKTPGLDRTRKNWNFQADFSFRPYRFETLSLKKAANLDFTDPVAGDGKGGWSDQGPDNDMRCFPIRMKQFGGVDFDLVDPAANGGRACMGFFSPEHAPAYPKNAEVAADGKAGKRLFLLHSLAWTPAKGTKIGTVNVCYRDGSVHAIPLYSGVDAGNFWQAGNHTNAFVCWSGENATAKVGLHLTRFPIPEKPVEKIEFHSEGKGIWLVSGVTLGNDEPPRPEGETIQMLPGKNWLPLENSKKFEKGSVIDLSGLLDAPAGKYGSVVIRNGQFEFENRPGKQARFWGGNIAFSTNFMNDANFRRLLDGAAFAGYNLIRLHHFDQVLGKKIGKTSTTLNEKPMERMDKLVAMAKERGIYLTLDLFILRTLAKGEVAELPNHAVRPHELKALAFLSSSARKSWEDFTRNLLNHVNPYTGIAWKHEPAIGFISLINEDALYSTAVRSSPAVRNLFEQKFEKYLAKKGIRTTPANRKQLWNIFLTETYRRGYARMKKFVRELGCEKPLTDQNHWDSIPMALSRNDYDYVDNHFYWQHPSFPGNDWKLPAKVGNRSAINAVGGTLAAMFPTRIIGKPFTITEWDFVNPSSYVAEGSLLTGAYASLQGWDALCRFALSHGGTATMEEDRHPAAFFDIVNDPIRLLSERGGALFYLRGDVKTADDVSPLLISTRHLETPGYPDTNPKMVRESGLVGRTGTIVGEPGKPVRLPENTRAVFAVSSQNLTRGLRKPVIPIQLASEKFNAKNSVPFRGNVDSERGIFRSSTGELELNSGDNTFRAVTPWSEGFVLPEGKSLAGAVASVKNRLAYGTFLIAAVDGKPLRESGRILILHLTESKNTMQTFIGKEFNFVTDWGRSPLLIRRGEAEISLQKSGDFTLYACSVTGKRIAEIPLERTPEALRFTARNNRFPTPVMVYELIRK